MGLTSEQCATTQRQRVRTDGPVVQEDRHQGGERGECANVQGPIDVPRASTSPYLELATARLHRTKQEEGPPSGPGDRDSPEYYILLL